MPAANGQIAGTKPSRPATGEGGFRRRLSEIGARTYKPHLWGYNQKIVNAETRWDLDKVAKRDRDAFGRAIAERDFDKTD